MKKLQTARFSVLMICCFLVSFAPAQGERNTQDSRVDRSIKTAFEALRQKNYREARTRFEYALAQFDRELTPSDWLFTKFTLPDEDPSNPPASENERKIQSWRHATGTRQALLTFLAFTSQLEGNNVLAKKYFDEIYAMQGPVWGLSWRTFIPPVQALYHTSIEREESENFGRYLSMSGQLLWSAGEEVGLKLAREGQRLAPKDSEVAARLASFLVIKLDADGAKKYAELSLSIKPNQTAVLIDLAIADWLLADIPSAVKHATAAQKLAPDLPGPHGTLMLAALELGDLRNAISEAETGVKLSDRHPFYVTLLAAALEASGRSKEAEALITEAWGNQLPDAEDLKTWYFRGKSFDLVTRIAGRIKRP